MTDAYVVKSTKGLGDLINKCLSTGFMLGVFLSLFVSSPVGAANLSDLQNVINNLDLRVNEDLAQNVEVLDAIGVALSPRQTLILGNVPGDKGKSVDLTVYYKASTAPVSTLQLDVSLPTGISITSVSPGIAALAASKGTSGNALTGAYRVIVFGINANVIPSGPVAILKVAIAASRASGKVTLPLTGVVASNPDGVAVPLAARSGSVTVR